MTATQIIQGARVASACLTLVTACVITARGSFVCYLTPDTCLTDAKKIWFATIGCRRIDLHVPLTPSRNDWGWSHGS